MLVELDLDLISMEIWEKNVCRSIERVIYEDLNMSSLKENEVDGAKWNVRIQFLAYIGMDN